MFQLVEKDIITAPLFDPTTVNDPEMNNKKYLRGYLSNLFGTAFPHLLSCVLPVLLSWAMCSS